ncbi:S-layer homology domain-containing protein [Candidatus Gracilibacteria bacterium]|nr:S-layer homology domain-containing protein [Candidatus Gracilibacteria bacterium]
MNLPKLTAIGLLLVATISTTFAYTLKEIEAAQYLANLNIIQDHDNLEDFQLGYFITRKEVMKTVGKLSADKIGDKCDGTFLDVDVNDWGCKYIEFALRKGLIEQNTNFRPEDLITKTEAVKLILKVKGVEKTQVTTQWQEDYMMTAFEKGIIEEKYTNYNATATRGWIFKIATAVIKQDRLEKMKNGEFDIYSDEAL